MKLVVTRETRNDEKDSITGSLFVNGDFECYTVERKSLSIPEGTYKVSQFHSPRLGYEVLLLHSVPGRDSIEIHIANTPSDVIGCIGVGQYNYGWYIGNSRVAFKHLMDSVRQLPEDESLEITIQ